MFYLVGNVPHLAVSWYDNSTPPNLVDPGALTLTITLPDQTTAGPFTPTRASTGLYSYDYTTTQAGRHTALWTGTGTNASVYPQEFDVSTADPGFVIGLSEAKTQLSITSTTNDAELMTWLGVTTDIVEYFCGDVVPRTWAETYDGGSATIALRHHPIISVTSVVEWIGTTNYTLTLQPFGSAVSAYGFQIDDPIGGVISRRTSGSWPQPFMYGQQNVLITYSAGMSVVPWYVQGAARLILQALWTSRRGAMPMPMPATGPPETANVNGYAIPIDAIMMLDRGERLPGVA